MVLATRRDRQLFGGPDRRCPRGASLARHLARDGRDRHLEYAVVPIAEAFSAEGKPVGEAGHSRGRAFPRFADDLFWWAEAAKTQRAHKAPPY